MSSKEKQDQWISGNAIIAEFMGATYVPAFEDKRRFVAKSSSDIAPADESYGEGYKVNGGYVAIDDLKYHTSWDWQVPVWQKAINLLRPIVMKHDELKHPDIEKYFELKREYYDCVEDNNPQAGQLVLIAAITFYNQQTK